MLVCLVTYLGPSSKYSFHTHPSHGFDTEMNNDWGNNEIVGDRNVEKILSLTVFYLTDCSWQVCGFALDSGPATQALYTDHAMQAFRRQPDPVREVCVHKLFSRPAALVVVNLPRRCRREDPQPDPGVFEVPCKVETLVVVGDGRNGDVAACWVERSTHSVRFIPRHPCVSVQA